MLDSKIVCRTFSISFILISYKEAAKLFFSIIRFVLFLVFFNNLIGRTISFPSRHLETAVGISSAFIVSFSLKHP